MQTHETYIQEVAQAVIWHMSDEDKERAKAVKLVYGAGHEGLRGIT